MLPIWLMRHPLSFADTSFGSTSGTISGDRTGATLSGGTITFDGDADAAAVRFALSDGTTNTLGIIGVATDAAALPSGSASYTGDVAVADLERAQIFDHDHTTARSQRGYRRIAKGEIHSLLP